MRNKLAKYNRKKIRKESIQFLCLLKAQMTFWERVKFCFTGEDIKPLMRVLKRLKINHKDVA
jgi:hypothetical protein